ncbi:MAG: hypothetical protein WDN69_08490 [Aliidongia sp.]
MHHLVSAVEGRLRPGAGRIDLLRATFPGGLDQPARRSCAPWS